MEDHMEDHSSKIIMYGHFIPLIIRQYIASSNSLTNGADFKYLFLLIYIYVHSTA